MKGGELPNNLVTLRFSRSTTEVLIVTESKSTILALPEENHYNFFIYIVCILLSKYNNGTNIQPSTRQSFLFTLHVSTTMGHLQVFSVI
jgi:hypothetical protein